MKNVVRRLALSAGVALAATVVAASPSTAATSDVTVTFTEQDPAWDLIYHAPCSVTPVTNVARYREVEVDVSATGTYTGTVQRSGGFSQGILALRKADGTCFPFRDSPTTLTFEAGRYSAIIASFDGPGSAVSVRIDGPGTIRIVGQLPADLAELCAWDPADLPEQFTAVVGTPGNDRLVGTAAREVFYAGAGSDRVDGGGGDDVLCGGDGQDTLAGGAGDDVVVGGAGQDTLNGNAGADRLLGGDGQDTLYGDAGDDVLVGGAGTDVLDGGVGADSGSDADARTVFRNIESRV